MEADTTDVSQMEARIQNVLIFIFISSNKFEQSMEAIENKYSRQYNEKDLQACYTFLLLSFFVYRNNNHI
jgi:hypothetical protein